MLLCQKCLALLLKFQPFLFQLLNLKLTVSQLLVSDVVEHKQLDGVYNGVIDGVDNGVDDGVNVCVNDGVQSSHVGATCLDQ